jgi:hypothetical protein
MSLHPTTSNFRKGAIAFTTAATLGLAALFPAHGQTVGVGTPSTPSFTTDQCRLISAVTAEVFRFRGAPTLSAQFRQSMVNFIAPNGSLTCDGPREIITPTENDVSAFNTIRTILLAPPRRISLEQAGLRSVPRPTTVGSLIAN